jgi:hypothetical protein
MDGMKPICFFLCTLILLIGLSGCAVPAAPPAVNALGGLKITDIRDTSADLKRADFLISFRVFQYLIDPNNLGMLEPLYDATDRVVYQDKDAFNANGLGVTVVSRQEGSRIARTLHEAGAVRSGIGVISVPPETTDILTSSPVYQVQQISFIDFTGTQVSQPVYPGFLGWTLFAEDTVESGRIVLKLSPAYWQTGTEDLRIKMGKEPINFELLEFASLQTHLNVGDFLLLAPRRAPEGGTLDHALFAGSGRRPQVKCFVLICESAGL